MIYHKKMNLVLLIFSILFFALSLTTKCFCTDSSCGDSLAIFLAGIFCFFIGGVSFIWLANPFLFLSWILKNYKITSFILSSLALIISVSFLFIKQIIVNEGGSKEPITNYKLGFWLWILSISINFIRSLIYIIK